MRLYCIVALVLAPALALTLLAAPAQAQTETPTAAPVATETPTAAPVATETPTAIPAVVLDFTDVSTTTGLLMGDVVGFGEAESPFRMLYLSFAALIVGFGTFAFGAVIVWGGHRRN